MSLEDAASKSQNKDVSHLDDLIDEARTEDPDAADADTKRFNVEIPADLHQLIKVQAAQEDRPMKDLFLDAIEMYLAQR